MGKIIYAINAGPRKGWNSAQMLDSFIKGASDCDPTIEIRRVELYDIDFKGCRGCLACRLKTAEKGFCAFRDGAWELLHDIKTADGFAFAAPVYYGEVPSQMRGLMERLFYSGKVSGSIPVAILYTMNQPPENARRFFGHHLDDITRNFSNAFNTQAEEVFAYETLHWDHPELYEMPMEFYEERRARKERQFPIDLKSAYDAGARMAQKIGNQ